MRGEPHGDPTTLAAELWDLTAWTKEARDLRRGLERYLPRMEQGDTAVLRDGRRELHDASLTRLAARLPGDFSRVHKSYLVRLSLVRRIRARGAGHYALELSTGDVIPVGRTHYRTVRERLLTPEAPARRWPRSPGSGR